MMISEIGRENGISIKGKKSCKNIKLTWELIMSVLFSPALSDWILCSRYHRERAQMSRS